MAATDSNEAGALVGATERKKGRYDDQINALPRTDASGNPLSRGEIKRMRKELRRSLNAAWEKQKEQAKKAAKKAERRAMREQQAAAAATAAAAAGQQDAAQVAAVAGGNGDAAVPHKRARSPSLDGEADQAEPFVRQPKKRQRLLSSWLEAKQRGPKIVVDCDFDAHMNSGEMKSLSKQLAHVIAANRRAPQLVHVMATTADADASPLYRHLTMTNTIQRDSPGLELVGRSYLQAFDRAALVYLTPDSPHVLSDLDADKVYIVGGLVDHNRHKLLTLNKATEQGIAHAQLPISAFVKLSQRRVLAVNHVVQILMRFIETRDWKDAFMHAIPPRKIIGAAPDDAAPDDAANAGAASATGDAAREAQVSDVSADSDE